MHACMYVCMYGVLPPFGKVDFDHMIGQKKFGRVGPTHQ